MRSPTPSARCGWACRCRPTPTNCSTSPGATPWSGSRSAGPSRWACTHARCGPDGPGLTRPTYWRPDAPDSDSAPVRSGGSTWDGAATRPCTGNGSTTARGCSAAASSSITVRSCSRPARATSVRGCTPATAWDWTRSRTGSTAFSAAGRAIRCVHGRSSSTPGRPSTSGRTSTHCGSWPIGARRSAPSASCWTTAGSRVVATTAAVWVTGRFRRRCGPKVSAR